MIWETRGLKAKETYERVFYHRIACEESHGLPEFEFSAVFEVLRSDAAEDII